MPNTEFKIRTTYDIRAVSSPYRSDIDTTPRRFLNMIRKVLFSLAIAAAFASTSFAQEAEKAAPAEAKKAEIAKVEIDKDGKLVGKAFARLEGKETPLKAKVTLSANGVVIDTVTAKEDGSFSFANVEPGVYQMFGSSDGYFGGSSYNVQPFATGGQAPLLLQANSGVPYSTFSAAPGGGIGGGGGGFGGGGLLGNRRLLRLGLIGGVIAIASGDDSSPDE
ncbi:MAG: hypothetical protein AB8B55_18690 [Mariniblastus sp.]